MRAIYYGPPDAYPRYIASMLERHSKAFREEKHCRFAVVLDDALPADEEVASAKHSNGDSEDANENTNARSPPPKGKVVAAIKYYFVDAPSPSPPTDSTTSTSPSSSSGTRTWPPHSNAALASHFWSHLVAARSLLKSRLGAHVLVDNLYTDPTHHRRGAGGLLMRHACADADARGLPSMLEASPKGISVYQAVGFERFHEGGMDGRGGIWVDLERWMDGGDKGQEFEDARAREKGRKEGEGWYAQALMVRPARKGEAEPGKVPEMGRGETVVV